MNLFFKIITILFIFLFGASCSAIRTHTETTHYQIDYSTGGGFTGRESGMTIESNRLVIFWERKLMSSPIITDSTELTLTQLKTLNELMKNKEIFNYKNDYRGNYTAQLTFIKNGSNNSFSFNPSELPNNMPDVIKTILAEINNIHRHKERLP